VQQAVEAFAAVAEPPAEAAIEYVYAQWPTALAEQREMFLERAARRKAAAERGGDGHAQ
jgi:pyruvate dehydrogenase E1 component alpha subunit